MLMLPSIMYSQLEVNNNNEQLIKKYSPLEPSENLYVLSI